jgi:hypothetical protein
MAAWIIKYIESRLTAKYFSVLTWTYCTTVVSFLFFQNTFKYNPADAERCILDKLDIESKSGSANTIARCLILPAERVVAMCSIKLIATLHLTPRSRPRNMDADQQEMNIELHQVT